MSWSLHRVKKVRVEDSPDVRSPWQPEETTDEEDEPYDGSCELEAYALSPRDRPSSNDQVKHHSSLSSRTLNSTDTATTDARPVLVAPQFEEGFDSDLERCDMTKDNYDEGTDSWDSWNRFAVSESNKWRNLWSVILAILLVYTATIMPYTLCFLDFRLTGAYDTAVGWKIFESIVDYLFWFDLFINFFFTYVDANGNEVRHLKKIVPHYLKGYFGLNLIACLPEEAFGAVLPSNDGGEGGDSPVNRLTRLSRVQRIARLSRLLRLSRLMKLVPFMKENPIWLWLQHLRGVRIINFTFGLLWAVHLVACGWYLCAAMHNDIEITWVARRGLDGNRSLLDQGPFDQWLHSMYFVLTVFSTVGFGDMSPLTNGEIVYGCWAMLVGAVVHGIIMSEVINIVTEMDDKAVEHSNQRQVIKAFAEHTELEDAVTKDIVSWIDPKTQSRRMAHQYDVGAVKRMLTSGAMPYSLMEQLPHSVYGGQLLKNNFLEICRKRAPGCRLPPRFPLFLAVGMVRHDYYRGEVVYQLHDHPFNIYLVASGCFGDVGVPTPEGGSDVLISRSAPPTMRRSNSAKQLLGTRSQEKEVPPLWRGMHTMKTLSIDEPPSRKNIRGSISELALEVVTGKAKPTPTPKQTGKMLQRQTKSFFPYRLHAFKSYFGDYEVLMQIRNNVSANISSGPTSVDTGNSRTCTVRCESEMGSLLVLGRQDLQNLLKEFPHFGEAWYVASRNREAARHRSLKRLQRGMAYRHFSAHSIQRLWRLRKKSGKPLGLGCSAAGGGGCLDSMVGLGHTLKVHRESIEAMEAGLGDIADGGQEIEGGPHVTHVMSGFGQPGMSYDGTGHFASQEGSAISHLRKEMRHELGEVKGSIAEIKAMLSALTGAAPRELGESQAPPSASPMRVSPITSEAPGPPVLARPSSPHQLN